MSRKLFPVEVLEEADAGLEPAYDPSLGATDLLADVTIHSRDTTYPIRDRSRTLFATGRFQTCLAGPELDHAVRKGHVARWHGYVRFRLADLFSDFVSEHWKRRVWAKSNGYKAWDRVSKLTLNSLWGRFAQRSPEWVECRDPGIAADYCEVPIINADQGTMTLYRKVGGVCFQKVERADHPDAYPAVAAWVTSYGRELLRELCSIAGRGHVYYVGVDSLIVDQAGYDNLCLAGRVGGAELGDLRVEWEGDDVDFGGLNRYRTGPVRHYAGVSKHARQVRPGVYEQDAQGHLFPALIQGPRDKVLSLRFDLDIRRPIVAGRQRPDGWVDPPEIYHTPF